MCLDCDFERENVDLKFVFVISLFVFVFVIVIVIVFGSEIFFFFLVGPRIGPNPLTGPVGPGKKTRLVNGPGPGHGSWPAGRVRV